MKVAKKFRFDAGHRLVKHKGKCSNLHGHTYLGEVIVEGVVSEYSGMVIDFSDLKRILNDLMLLFDHSFIANQEDTELVELCKKNAWKLMIMGREPTVENISEFILQYVKDKLVKMGLLPHIINSIEVVLYETPDSYAVTKWRVRE